MLSGGQQQRVAVARALANRPSVILGDEPTASLDGHRGRQVMELFAKVAHEQGAGVIVVTHDHRALDVFDTIYGMEDGSPVISRSLGFARRILSPSTSDVGAASTRSGDHTFPNASHVGSRCGEGGAFVHKPGSRARAATRSS
jgi:energy-coupling factor transporter ATP-binding protein EcfA2